MSKKITRRDFIKRGSIGVAAGSALLTSNAASYARIIGSNERLNLAVVGIRGRGRSLIENFAGMKNVRVKTLVDIDENLFADRVKKVEEMAGYKPKTVWDMRKAFDDKEIDAVGIATPNHWHALATIWAAQAGKHVYVEKPSSHNVFEGRKMVEASRKYNVLVQVGFQNRSRVSTNRGIKFMRDGKLGKIYMARGLCFKPRADIGKYPDGPLKPGEKFRMNLETSGYQPPYTEEYLKKVHYEMWLGPAPDRAFNRNRFHYNWHWHWDYGNGDTGNQGPHQFDIARWGLGKDEYPVSVRSYGGYFAYDGAQETPNTQTSIFEYADGCILEFGTRGLFTNPEGVLLPDIQISSTGQISSSTKAKPVTIGNVFLGTEGWMQMDSGGNWQTFFGRNNEPGPTSGDTNDDSYDPMNLAGAGGGGHFNNFIAAVKSGKRSDLTCDIEEGHKSSALPIIANVSYRLKRDLAIDGKNENFGDDKEANAMLTRKYREPYIVPEKV
ncbi:MAG: gfo/Idh/MocA family oxidoreductase [Calditrichaeota bacterium]|nr:MAG: gfo/Idh/MocA family oxidoreductase [Calditrichota bacterium]